MKSLREKVQDMRPLEAVDFLLDVIEQLAPAVASDEHPVDNLVGHLSPQQRRILAVLYDASPRFLSHGNILDVMGCDRVADQNLPDISTLRTQIHRVRSALPAEVGEIVNEWGRGYSFVPAETRCRAGVA